MGKHPGGVQNPAQRKYGTGASLRGRNVSDQTGVIFKLRIADQIPKGSTILGFIDEDGNDVPIKFHYTDGAYSYCTIGEEVVPITASMPLEEVSEGVFRLIESDDK